MLFQLTWLQKSTQLEWDLVYLNFSNSQTLVSKRPIRFTTTAAMYCVKCFKCSPSSHNQSKVIVLILHCRSLYEIQVAHVLTILVSILHHPYNFVTPVWNIIWTGMVGMHLENRDQQPSWYNNTTLLTRSQQQPNMYVVILWFYHTQNTWWKLRKISNFSARNTTTPTQVQKIYMIVRNRFWN